MPQKGTKLSLLFNHLLLNYLTQCHLTSKHPASHYSNYLTSVACPVLPAPTAGARQEVSTWQPPSPTPLRADLYTATHAPATRSCPALQTIQVHTKYKQTNHLTNVIDRWGDSVGTLFIHS